MTMTLQNETGTAAVSRNFQNIHRKYLQYLIPCTLTAFATSLNEFVDSIVVANLLDTSALSVVNLAWPVMFVFATVYTVLGVGGSALYSVSRGKHERKKADEIFSLSMFAAFLASIFLTAVGFVFSPVFGRLLGRGTGLEAELSSYLKVLSCAALPIIVSCSFAMFLPACGHPALATVLNLVSNGVNLVFDFIYIRWFNMGVNGAALATLTGFSVGLVILVVAYLRKKKDIAILRFSRGIFVHFKAVFDTGFPAASTQFGYGIKVAFFNLYAAKFAGEGGVVAVTIYMQMISIVYVFMGGVYDTMQPFYGTLKGMNDRKGQMYVIRLSSAILGAISCVTFLILQLCPQIMLYIYAIKSPDVSKIVITAVRIFSWLQLCRWLYLQLRNILAVNGMKWYSLSISLADGFVLPILFSLILCPIMGLTGLWWALTLTSVVITAVVFIINKVISSRSGGKYKGFWLQGKSANLIADLTIDSDLNNISAVTGEIECLCRRNAFMMSHSMLVAITVEEMSSIIRDNSGARTTPIDILIQQRNNEILVDFRSIGVPLDLAVKVNDGDFDSIEMLRRISKSVSASYDHVLGMNLTRIVLSLESRGRFC